MLPLSSSTCPSKFSLFVPAGRVQQFPPVFVAHVVMLSALAKKHYLFAFSLYSSACAWTHREWWQCIFCTNPSGLSVSYCDLRKGCFLLRNPRIEMGRYYDICKSGRWRVNCKKFLPQVSRLWLNLCLKIIHSRHAPLQKAIINLQQSIVDWDWVISDTFVFACSLSAISSLIYVFINIKCDVVLQRSLVFVLVLVFSYRNIIFYGEIYPHLYELVKGTTCTKIHTEYIETRMYTFATEIRCSFMLSTVLSSTLLLRVTSHYQTLNTNHTSIH